MDKGKKIIGILLIAVSITALTAWERWGKAQLLYSDVVVCRENLSKGTVIREDMLQTVKMDIREKGFITPEKAKGLIGREAAFFIHKGVPLFNEYFTEAASAAGSERGTYVLSVPATWLDSFPGSLEIGNRAYFYYNGREIASAPVTAVNAEEKTAEVAVREQQVRKLSEIAAEGGKFVIIYN